MKDYNYRTLVSAGCSHTAGAEIEKVYQPTCYEKAWPKHFANLLNTSKYINLAYSGYSNDSIFRVVQNWVIENIIVEKKYQPSDVIFTILWTGVNRWERYIPNPGLKEYDDTYPHNRLVNLSPAWRFELDNWEPGTEQEFKDFVNHKIRTHDNLFEDFKTLQLIVNLENWLTQLDIENYHGNSINGLPGANYVPTAYKGHPLENNYLNLLKLYKRRKYHYAFLSHNRTFWNTYNNDPNFNFSKFSKGNHFGEDVHIDFANKLYDFWIDPDLPQHKLEHHHSNTC